MDILRKNICEDAAATISLINLRLLGIPDDQDCGIPRTEYLLTNVKYLMRWKQGNGAKVVVVVVVVQ